MGQTHQRDSFSFGNKRKRSQIKLQQENWTILQKPQLDTSQMGSYAIYKNKVTGEIARGYSLHFESKRSLDCYIDEFNYWRSQSHWNVIDSKYIVYNNDSFILSQLCGSYFPVKIFVENPVVILSDIKDIPIPEGLSILLSALVGFEHLFQIFGYFPVKESMITINEQGVVKVWINPDLSKNRPLCVNLQQVRVSDMQNPDRFIQQLIELINSNIDYSETASTFTEYMDNLQDKKKCISFGNCRKHLLNFAQEMQIDLPDSVVLILDLLFDKSNRTSFSNRDFMQNNENPLYQREEMNEEGSQNDGKSAQLENDNLLSKNSQLRAGSENYEIHSFRPEGNGPAMSRQLLQTHSSKSQHYPQNSFRKHPSQISSPPYAYSPNFSNQQQTLPNRAYQIQQIAVYNNLQRPQINNVCQSLVQLQRFQKQSTIREEVQEDSFLTSYKNSKFPSSRDAKQLLNHHKNKKKNKSHRYSLTPESDCKMHILIDENYLPQQDHVKQQFQNMKESASQQSMMSKRSQKSIKFHTLYQVMQLDAEIAEDLQKMLNGIVK